MENIVEKIKLLNYSDTEKESLAKFMTPLFDTIVSPDEFKHIVDYLKENGILITKPSQNKVFASGFDYIYETVEEYKQIGLLSALIEDPVRINAKNSIARIKYMIAKGDKLTKPNGKYLKRLFSKRLFEKEYGDVDLDIVEEIPEPVLESAPEFDPLAADMYHGEEEPESEISKLFAEANELDEYEAVLASPQVPADDDAITRFDMLYQDLGQILQKLYNAGNNVVSVPDTVSAYLMKLVAQKMPDDAKVLFYSLTYGKTLTAEEKRYVKNKIKAVLKNQNQDDVIELESIT